MWIYRFIAKLCTIVGRWAFRHTVHQSTSAKEPTTIQQEIGRNFGLLFYIDKDSGDVIVDSMVIYTFEKHKKQALPDRVISRAFDFSMAGHTPQNISPISLERAITLLEELPTKTIIE